MLPGVMNGGGGRGRGGSKKNARNKPTFKGNPSEFNAASVNKINSEPQPGCSKSQNTNTVAIVEYTPPALEVEENYAIQTTVCPQKNPLQIKYVVEMVAKYLAIPELIQSSLVCKLWNEEMRRCQNKRGILSVVKNNVVDAENMLLKKKEDESFTLSTIRLTGVDMNNKYFNRLTANFGYLLDVLSLTKCKVNLPVLNSLLVRQLPNLRILVLKDLTYVETGAIIPYYFPALIHGEVPMHSRLQRLVLETHRPDATGRRQIPIHLEDIIQRYPNLKDLECTAFPEVRSKKFFSGYQWDSLCKLSVAATTHADVEFLAQSGIKLKSLKSLSLRGLIYTISSTTDKLKVIIESVSQTLEELCLDESNDDELHPFAMLAAMVNNSSLSKENIVSCFPIDLPKLKSIDLSRHLFNSFNMLDQMPQLESFTCQANIQFWEKVCRKSDCRKRYLGVRSLLLGRTNAKTLNRMARMFPNVEFLTLVDPEIHDRLLGSACRNFSQLGSFDIHMLESDNESFTDSAITGISIFDCRRILDEKSWEDVNIIKLRKFPFIGDLKELGDFTFDGIMDKLTDVSVLFGFIHLTNLMFLNLTNSQITDISLEAIGKHMPELRELTITGCKGVTEDGIKILQELRKELDIVVNEEADCFSDLDVSDEEDDSEHSSDSDSEEYYDSDVPFDMDFDPFDDFRNFKYANYVDGFEMDDDDSDDGYNSNFRAICAALGFDSDSD